MVQKNRKKPIYEGKAKCLYEGPEPDTLIQHFKDDATAFNNEKKGTISGKGVINNRISGLLMTRLGEMGIPTHYIRNLNMREQLVRHVEIIPVEVVTRNYVAGNMAKRLGMEEGIQLPTPIIEFYYKNDALGDPLVTEDHVVIFDWMAPEELEIIRQLTFRINDILSGLFAGCNLRLIDFKLEFGRIYLEDEGLLQIVLADEISPDTCRLWDMDTNEKMDKDRFRRNLGGEAEAYQEVARRLGVMGRDDNVEEIK
jgi:phosphoribosylaminoimidazole-succinocarboxamide synthase